MVGESFLGSPAISFASASGFRSSAIRGFAHLNPRSIDQVAVLIRSHFRLMGGEPGTVQSSRVCR